MNLIKNLLSKAGNFVHWKKIFIAVIVLICALALFGFCALALFGYCTTPPKNDEQVFNDASFAQVCQRNEASDGYEPAEITCIESIILSGRIDNLLVEKFKRRIAENKASTKKVDTVCLSSKGGKTHSALLIHGLIREHNFNTCIGDYIKVKLPSDADENLKSIAAKVELPALTNDVNCASACPFILLAGKERIGKGVFKVKVHGAGKTWYCGPCMGDRLYMWGLFNGDFKDMIKVDAKEPPEGFKRFYDIAASHPFTERKLLEISNKDLIEMNVFTKIED